LPKAETRFASAKGTTQMLTMALTQEGCKMALGKPLREVVRDGECKNARTPAPVPAAAEAEGDAANAVAAADGSDSAGVEEGAAE